MVWALAAKSSSWLLSQYALLWGLRSTSCRIRQILERLIESVCSASSKVATISSNVHLVTVRSCSLDDALATEMTWTRVGEAIVRGRPERMASCRPGKPRSRERRRHLPTVRLEQPNSWPILRLVGRSSSAALKTMRARNASDCGVDWARATACRSVRAFCDKMMGGAMGVGIGCLLAKRP